MAEEKAFSYAQYRSKFSEHELKHAPKELFYEGNASLLTNGIRVSVVGSRKPSEDGATRAKIFTLELVKRGIIVVSGS